MRTMQQDDVHAIAGDYALTQVVVEPFEGGANSSFVLRSLLAARRFPLALVTGPDESGLPQQRHVRPTAGMCLLQLQLLMHLPPVGWRVFGNLVCS